MDFGLVESNQVNNIDYTLPVDGEQTLALFRDKQKTPAPDIRVGLVKWGRKEWVGKLYPVKTKEHQFLGEYSRLFQTIELNAVFYSIPAEDLILKWKQMLSSKNQENFLFLPKMSRVISHIKRLSNAEQETTQFIDTVKQFGHNLGPILIQIGDNFGPKKFSDLEHFVKSLPADQRFFIELRHEQWFSDPIDRKSVFDLFSKYKIGTVITDTPGRRDCLHMELTIPEAYIRFNGVDADFRTIDFYRIDTWVERLHTWMEKGLEKIYFIVTQKDEVDTPLLAQYVIERFNEKLGSTIPDIVWKVDQHQ